MLRKSIPVLDRFQKGLHWEPRFDNKLGPPGGNWFLAFPPKLYRMQDKDPHRFAVLAGKGNLVCGENDFLRIALRALHLNIQPLPALPGNEIVRPAGSLYRTAFHFLLL